MKQTRRIACAAAMLCGIIFATTSAGASTVARWIQLGPGSSAPTPTNYGDQPTGLTPTVLARALITANSQGCPSTVLEDGTTLTMTARFNAGTQLNSLPAEATEASGDPSAFVSNTTPGTFPWGDPMATTDWTVCEVVVPNAASHVTATIDGVSLKLPIAHPQRILVIGDTGCRLKSASQQDCLNPSNFPLNYLANYEAQFAPDLIVHVGDYFYRDSNCSASGYNSFGLAQNGCANPESPPSTITLPWGDDFDSWNGDFFLPAANLLETAPWIMVRGNHESCGRGARGWFALLDPHPFNISNVGCAPQTSGTGANAVYSHPVGGSGGTPTASYSPDFTPSYVVPAGQVNFIVHDSSYANDSAVDAVMAANYDADMTAMLAAMRTVAPGQPFVYATHKPTYGLVSGGFDNPYNAGTPGNANGGDFTEQYSFSGNANSAAFPGYTSAFAGGVVPTAISLFLSGHIHQFEYVNFTNNTNYAPQLIVGMSGDNIDYSANPASGVQPTTQVSAATLATENTELTYQYATSGTPRSFDVHSNSNTATVTAAPITNAYSQAEFGFAVLDATPTGYTASVYNIGSNKAGRCVITLSPRSIQCWK